jgi:hypothetical protein
LSSAALAHTTGEGDTKKTKLEATTSDVEAPAFSVTSPDVAASSEPAVERATDDATEPVVFILWADGILSLLGHTIQDEDDHDDYSDSDDSEGIVRLKAEVLEAARPSSTDTEDEDKDVDENEEEKTSDELFSRVRSINQWYIYAHVATRTPSNGLWSSLKCIIALPLMRRRTSGGMTWCCIAKSPWIERMYYK